MTFARGAAPIAPGGLPLLGYWGDPSPIPAGGGTLPAAGTSVRRIRTAGFAAVLIESPSFLGTMLGRVKVEPRWSSPGYAGVQDRKYVVGAPIIIDATCTGLSVVLPVLGDELALNITTTAGGSQFFNVQVYGIPTAEQAAQYRVGTVLYNEVALVCGPGVFTTRTVPLVTGDRIRLTVSTVCTSWAVWGMAIADLATGTRAYCFAIDHVGPAGVGSDVGRLVPGAVNVLFYNRDAVNRAFDASIIVDPI